MHKPWQSWRILGYRGTIRRNRFLMQHPAQTDNLRESFRCAADESKQAAELRVGGEWVPAKLLDESAGGFGVRVDRPLGVSVGDLLQLRLADECFEAHVTNVVEEAPSGDGEEPTFRLGLKRVGEIFLDVEEKWPWFERFIRLRRYKPFGSARTMFRAVLVFTVMAGAAPVIIIYLLNLHGSGDLVLASHAGVESGEVMQPWDSNSEPSATRPAGKPVDFSDDSLPNHKTIKRFLFGTKKPPLAEPRLNERRDASLLLLLDHAAFQSNLGKWSDAMLAVIANLAEKLSLTDPQKEEIGGILQDADEAIVRLNVPDPDNTPQKVARQRASILGTAYGKLIQVFTDAQRIQWDELVKKWGEEIKTSG